MMATLAAMNVALLGMAGCSPASSLVASATPSSGTALTYNSQAVGDAGLASNINVPGATGQTSMPGNNSTIAGDMAAAGLFQTCQYGR